MLNAYNADRSFRAGKAYIHTNAKRELRIRELLVNLPRVGITGGIIPFRFRKVYLDNSPKGEVNRVKKLDSNAEPNVSRSATQDLFGIELDRVGTNTEAFRQYGILEFSLGRLTPNTAELVNANAIQ